MNSKEKNTKEKKAKSCIPVIMFVVAVIVCLAGIAVLTFNIMSFKSAVTQYVSQGIPEATVTSYLIPQFIPEFLQSLLYIGVAFALFGIGMAYRKITAYALTIEDVFDDGCADEECSGEAPAEIDAPAEDGEVVNDGEEATESAEPATPAETAEDSGEENK